jgi:hypothetical protein
MLNQEKSAFVVSSGSGIKVQTRRKWESNSRRLLRTFGEFLLPPKTGPDMDLNEVNFARDSCVQVSNRIQVSDYGVSQAQSAKVVPSEKCVKFAQTQNLIVENKALLTR